MPDPRYPSSKEVEEFHRNADTDGSSKSVHHTLGSGQSQAAPGNHTHTGGDSVTLDRLLDGVTISGSKRGGSVQAKIIAALVGLGATDTSSDDNDKMPNAFACGTVDVPITAINTTMAYTVNLPAGRFSSTPFVVVTPSIVVPEQVQWSVSGLGPSQFTIRVRRTTLTSVTFSWQAAL